jgi:hypothetical protein
LLQRLALGISLEHAVSIAQSNARAETDAPATVDPVKRYLHFEKAYLDGELDPGLRIRNHHEWWRVWSARVLRTFHPALLGIPTVARPQRGHASLCHWTPDGWVICLGAGWGWGWTSYGQDRDFLAHGQG